VRTWPDAGEAAASTAAVSSGRTSHRLMLGSIANSCKEEPRRTVKVR
jgi:hypothetical protein